MNRSKLMNHTGGGRSRRLRIGRLAFLVTALLVTAGLVAGVPARVLADDDDATAATATWRNSKSKTASNLAGTANNLTSTVTLSLPSASEALFSDVVFVLDTSDCTNGTLAALVGTKDYPGPLMQLSEVAEETHSTIKVGVVVFKGSAGYLFEGKMLDVDDAVSQLNTFTSNVTSENDVLPYLTPVSSSEFINKGSNMHSGLLAAQSMLEADTSVANSRKMVVTIGDGLNYYWNEGDDVYAVYAAQYNDDLADGSNTVPNALNSLFYTWEETYGISTSYPFTVPSAWASNGIGSYISEAGSRRTADVNAGDPYKTNLRTLMTNLRGLYATDPGYNWGTIRYTIGEPAGAIYSGTTISTFDFINAGGTYVKHADLTAHSLGAERATLACIDTYQDMIDEGFRCYAYCSTSNREAGSNGVYPSSSWSYQFIAYLNQLAGVTTGSNSFDSDDIYTQILYLLGPGSQVVDEIADGFELVSGTIEVTVGDTTYTAEQIEENHWGFAPGSYEQADGTVRGYAYEVAYANGSTETLTWTINVPVSNFERVSLSYDVTPSSYETAAGTYGQYSADGSDNYDGLLTNASAIITPRTSAGATLADEAFGRPTVSYTVVGVTKVWSDDAARHDAVSVDVLDSNGTAVATLTLSEDDAWYASVALPEGTYTVVESEVPDGYTSAVTTGEVASDFTVTNTLTTTTTTTTTTTKAASNLPNTGDVSAIAGALVALAGGTGVLAAGMKRRNRR